MPTTTHQTVVLRRGKHDSPERGVCVMELASMLAGEPFSDRPTCVSPLIAAFLRAYNDVVRARRRQDLYGCAAAVVGTRAEAAEEARRLHCLRAVDELERRRRRSPLWRWRSPAPRQLRHAIIEFPLDESMGLLAQAFSAGGAAGHALALRVVGELAEIGRGEQVDPPGERLAAACAAAPRIAHRAA